jgi:AraC-like DNA-binding protein
MSKEIEYHIVTPDALLADFVDSFWRLYNHSDTDQEVVVLPDGRIDLFFSRSATEPFHITLLGLSTYPEKAIIKAGTSTFAVSFKPLAIEYILNESVADIINSAKNLPPDIWEINTINCTDFNGFCNEMATKIKERIPHAVDDRKKRLFHLLYQSNGALTVKTLSEEVFWSSRQINRYFNQLLGLSMKTYSSILRFRASFPHIKKGKLFPEQNFTDQSHFIKEVKKLSGVLPKELKQNQNGRFIQFSTLNEK